MKSRYTTLVLFLALGACSPDQVTLCGSAIVDPHSAPLAVGDSTTLTASFDQTHGCTPPAPAGQLRWSTADAGTARVDSITGVVIGVAPGTVDIAVRLQGTQTTLGSGRVVVFAPLFDRIVIDSAAHHLFHAVVLGVVQQRADRHLDARGEWLGSACSA